MPTRRAIAPVRLKHLLWLPPVLALSLFDLRALPTPHLRFSASYTGTSDFRVYQRCHYVGLHSRTIHPPDGNCPVIALLPEQ